MVNLFNNGIDQTIDRTIIFAIENKLSCIKRNVDLLKQRKIKRICICNIWDVENDWDYYSILIGAKYSDIKCYDIDEHRNKSLNTERTNLLRKLLKDIF